MTATVAVVICAYTMRRWSELANAVASVRRQDHRADDLVVVVDHNDELFNRAAASLGVRVVANQGPRGLSGARNTGVDETTGDIIAFLDDDAVAASDWLQRLLFHYEDASVLGVGGSITPVWPRGRPSFLPTEFDWVVGCTYTGMPTTVSPVRNMIGANMSFRRDVLSRVGGFNSAVGRVGTRPMGCEETELCLRAQMLWPQGRFIYDPGAQVVHKMAMDRGSWRYFRSRCYSEGLSKALVGRSVGRGRGLASERTYVLRTLPRAFAREVRGGLQRRESHGLSRALAMVLGLALTTSGYIAGVWHSPNVAPETLPAPGSRKPLAGRSAITRAGPSSTPTNPAHGARAGA